MDLTQEQIISAGYQLPAAPVDAWRHYDERNPIPGYFQFDWLSARHPDLYHAFALSTLGLMNELDKLVDLRGLEVIDIGAGTGRSALEAAKKAQRVIALDAYESVARFGREMVRRAGRGNVTYIRGDRAHLPLADSSVDAALSSWALMQPVEAYRVLKPDGYLILLEGAPGALCGELTATLADVYPGLITAVAPADRFLPSCPVVDSLIQDRAWHGVPVTPPTIVHDFTYVADYGDYREAAAILGRFYGPRAKQYMLDRRQATLSWRLRITVGRVRK